jgi:hypothetical protein
MKPVGSATRNPLNVRFSLLTLSLTVRLGHLRPGWERLRLMLRPTLRPLAWLAPGALQGNARPNIIDAAVQRVLEPAPPQTHGCSGQLMRDSAQRTGISWRHSAPTSFGADETSATAHNRTIGRMSASQALEHGSWRTRNRLSQIPTLAEGTLVQPDV